MLWALGWLLLGASPAAATFGWLTGDGGGGGQSLCPSMNVENDDQCWKHCDKAIQQAHLCYFTGGCNCNNMLVQNDAGNATGDHFANCHACHQAVNNNNLQLNLEGSDYEDHDFFNKIVADTFGPLFSQCSPNSGDCPPPAPPPVTIPEGGEAQTSASAVPATDGGGAKSSVGPPAPPPPAPPPERVTVHSTITVPGPPTTNMHYVSLVSQHSPQQLVVTHEVTVTHANPQKIVTMTSGSACAFTNTLPPTATKIVTVTPGQGDAGAHAYAGGGDGGGDAGGGGGNGQGPPPSDGQEPPRPQPSGTEVGRTDAGDSELQPSDGGATDGGDGSGA